MKQFTALFLTVLLLLSCVSCADVNPPISEETEPAPAETTGIPEEVTDPTDPESTEAVTSEATTTRTETETTYVYRDPPPHILDAPPAKQFDVLEVGKELSTNHYIDRENHFSDVYLYPIDRYTNSDSEPTKLIIFFDTMYELTYQESERTYLYGSEVDYYQYSDNAKTLKVYFECATGKIRELRYSDSRYLDALDPDDVLIEEECYEKALEFLSVLVDAEGYELTDKTVGSAGGFGGLCTYEFTRFIDGVKTANQVRISVTFCGDVVAYYLNTPEPLDLSKMPTGEALDALSQKVKDRWDSLHPSFPARLEFMSYEIEEIEFLRLFDGRYALLYTVKANFRERCESHYHSNYERAQYLVYLD